MDIPDWVSWSGIAASVSLVIALVSLVISASGRIAAARHHRRELAEGVGAWVLRERGELHFDVRNFSHAPAYDWKVEFVYGGESMGWTDTRRTALPANGHGDGPWPIRREIREAIVEVAQREGLRKFQVWHVQACIEFTDTRGTRWRRGVDGSLTKLG